MVMGLDWWNKSSYRILRQEIKDKRQEGLQLFGAFFVWGMFWNIGICTLMGNCIPLYTAAAQRQRHPLVSGLLGAGGSFSAFIECIVVAPLLCNLHSVKGYE